MAQNDYVIDETTYFTILHHSKTKKYSVYTAEKKIIEDADRADTSLLHPKHVKVKKNGKWTLYDAQGNPEKYAQNVDDLVCTDDNYYYANHKKHYTQQAKIKYSTILISTLAILGVVAKCCNDVIQSEKKLNNTPATYLNTKNRVAFFDTDGDKTTIEVIANEPSSGIDMAKMFNAKIQPGQTRLISEWKEKGFFNFSRVKKDNQKTR